MKQPINPDSILPTKRLKKEDLAGMDVLPFGKKHPVRSLIEALEPEEVLRISRLDFNWHRQTPSRFCNEISKRTNKKFQIWKQTNRHGWVVQRIDWVLQCNTQ